jgi:predicted phosphodiesterase
LSAAADTGLVAPDPTLIFVAGDTHGNWPWFRTLVELARRHHAQQMLQLGDFGLMPPGPDRFLDNIERELAEADLELWWIDGNHDDHSRLADANRDPDGIVTLRPHIRYIPRGTRWTWAGVRFGAFGGAVSVDRGWRTEWLNWWRAETPTQADADKLGTEPLDVLLTHEAPASARIVYDHHIGLIDEQLEAEVHASRVLLDTVVDATEPKLVLHGHHHQRVTNTIRDTVVEGLASDLEHGPGSWGLLELAAKTPAFRDGTKV